MSLTLLKSVQSGITAATGSDQASGVVLKANICVISVCANAGDAVTLPVAAKGAEIHLRNNGAASADVFPPVGGTINGGSLNAAFAVANSKGAVFHCTSSNGLTWITSLSA